MKLLYPSIWTLVLLWMASQSAFALDFDRYHSVSESDQYLFEIAHQYPGFARVETIGYSYLGRPLNMLICEGGESNPKHQNKIENIYINGTHHGDEKASTEVALGVIEYLARQQNQPGVKKLLRNFRFYIQPVVNPDGHIEHLRGDALGIDINRDYLDGDLGFRAQETRVVRDLLARIPFRAAIALHSGTEAVLWPQGHTSSPPPESATFAELARVTAKAMGFRRYLQSFLDYPTEGEFIDYAYDRHQILAITLELSVDHTPPVAALGAVVRRGVFGILAFLSALGHLDLRPMQMPRDAQLLALSTSKMPVLAK